MNYTAMDDCAHLEQQKQVGIWKKLKKDLATATAKIEALEARLAAAKTDLNQLSSRSWLKPMTRAEFAKRSLANLQMENTDA